MNGVAVSMGIKALVTMWCKRMLMVMTNDYFRDFHHRVFLSQTYVP